MEQREAIRSLDENYLVIPKQRRQASTKRTSAKFEEIRERLRTLALELGAGKQLPPIRELCTLLGTSSATLTAALDLLETEHILYRKERQGIFVAETINQKVIHIIFNVSGMTDIMQSPFWALLWAQLVKEVEYRSALKNEVCHFHLLCRQFGQRIPEAYTELMHSQQVSGCIVVGFNTRELDHTRILHIPHVVYAGGGDIMVEADIELSARLAAQKLIQQGCQKIGYWYPEWVETEGEEAPSEVKQLARLLTDQGLSFNPKFTRGLVVPPSVDRRSLSYQEQGYLLVKEVFSPFNDVKPDGIYITNDMITAGAFVAWEELGIRVGEDVKVVSHVNTGSPMLFGKTRQISIVEFDPADLVRTIFSLLDTAMSHGRYIPDEKTVQVRARLRG